MAQMAIQLPVPQNKNECLNVLKLKFEKDLNNALSIVKSTKPTTSSSFQN
jgi:hypothetical protein